MFRVRLLWILKYISLLSVSAPSTVTQMFLSSAASVIKSLLRVNGTLMSLVLSVAKRSNHILLHHLTTFPGGDIAGLVARCCQKPYPRKAERTLTCNVRGRKEEISKTSLSFPSCWLAFSRSSLGPRSAIKTKGNFLIRRWFHSWMRLNSVLQGEGTDHVQLLENETALGFQRQCIGRVWRGASPRVSVAKSIITHTDTHTCTAHVSTHEHHEEGLLCVQTQR